MFREIDDGSKHNNDKLLVRENERGDRVKIM